MPNLNEDKYAGDTAWREWFRICSVDGCPSNLAVPLREQVASAMYTRLARCGVEREETNGEDPIAVFDAFFKLKGSRDKDKPLKLYFAYRIKAEEIPLSNFICGTLFGSTSGRIHDIVTDWITSIKGWRPRTLRDENGKRHLVWEGAAKDDTVTLGLADNTDPAEFLDVAPMREEIDAALETVAKKIKVEKSKVALLLYVEAQDVPVTNPAVLEGLEVGKSRAYKLKENAVAALRRELRTSEGVGSPLFGRILLDACEEALPEATRAKIGAEQ